ncbi:MAG: hypothetical protein RBR71_03525 [Gudongella sp.]|nr:hypothetical protein [Gudongella sp.]
MKVKVIEAFTDRYTLKAIESGSELEVSKERFLELTEGPRGVFVEEIKKEVKKDTKKKSTKK